MPVVIIDNYDSFTFNLCQLVQSITGEEVQVFRNDAIDFTGLCSLAPERVIISPGPGHPGNACDFGVCRQVVLKHQELDCPVLGVCLGHQGIAHYLGGKVIPAPQIVHGKTSRIEVVAPSSLFHSLPDTFPAMRYHSLVVADDNLPCQLKVTARESSAGLIMGLEHQNGKLFGVQFHPESIGTPEGKKLMENFVLRC